MKAGEKAGYNTRVRDWLPLLALLALLSMLGVLLGGWLWLPFTYAGAFLGLGLCWLALKGLERLTSFRIK